MSVEVSAQYPGRSGSLLHEELPAPGGEGKGFQKSAESIVGAAPGSEGPKREEKTTAVMSMGSGVAAMGAEWERSGHRLPTGSPEGVGEAGVKCPRQPTGEACGTRRAAGLPRQDPRP